MRKCYTCGRKFKLLAKNRYEVVKRPFGINCLTEQPRYYNAFDCPHCGCQNVYGLIEKEKVNPDETTMMYEEDENGNR